MIVMQEAKDLSMISGRLKGLVEAVKSKKILTLIIEPTAKCDLACSFCSMHNGDFPTEDSKIDMSLETWGIVLDSIKSVPYKFNNIGFHGYGEPLLNKNIYRMLEDVRPYCETLKIITNGTALNLSNHRRLLDSGVDEVHVSLDVADRESFKKIKEKDQYERVLKNTIDGSALYSDSGTSQLFIKISLLSPNLEDFWGEGRSGKLSDYENALQKLGPLFRENKRVHLKVMPLFTAYNGHEKYVDEKPCEMPFYMAKIKSTGFVDACCIAMYDELSLGHISENRLDLHDRLTDIRKAQLSGNVSQSIPMCGSCGAKTVVDVMEVKEELISLL